MLFNSYPFLFVFLPLALLGYQIAGYFHRRLVIAWLGLASLAFYAYWRPALLYILLGSIAVNYLAAALISKQLPNKIPSRVWLTLAIVLDLAALGYFKYLFPSLNFLSAAAGSSWHWQDVVLPLGISFFTFTQIAFLVDLHQGIAAQQDIVSYVLFVTFFPHLIAGPILHHKDMMPQFQQERRYRLDLSDVAVGFTWFLMGLGKKVLIADKLALRVNPIFDAHVPLRLSAAWIGALFYSMQLYFDFSGYSDMALGLARMFSIDFPLNFNSPFKSKSIIDFWQRWHMTLSQYIMAYLYTPVQRVARARRQAAGKGVSARDMRSPGAFLSLIAGPMMFTLFIAGIWHGAGFQFIVYGLLHGFYLSVNHGWRLYRKKSAAPSLAPLARTVRHAACVLLTFLCVVVSFVFFRSSGVGHALSILASMAGMHRTATFTASGGQALKWVTLLLCFFIVWWMPNTQDILARFKPSLSRDAWLVEDAPRRLLWSPKLGWGVAFGLLFVVILTQMEDPSTFLYFQF